MSTRTIHILSNFKGLDRVAPAGVDLSFEHLEEMQSWSGAFGFWRKCARADLLILNIAQRELILACLLRFFCPWLRFRIISADLILRTPRTFMGRARAFLKRILFSRIHRFVLYFKNLAGYERFYGIRSDRAIYVPFKVNGWERVTAWPQDSLNGGEYVLCAGRTLRDVESFVEAMRRANCPGVLLQQQRELLAAHGTQSWTGDLPPNVRLVVDETDGPEAFFDFISRARIVVIPRFRHDIAPTGISTYLVAMALNRCVVISAGPGADDVLTEHEAVIVPPEDAGALASEIARLWKDDARRAEIAARGRAYALALEDELRLRRDILRVSLESLK